MTADRGPHKVQGGPPGEDTARTHWRRQLVLTGVTISVGLTSLVLTAQSVARERHVHQVVIADGRRVRSASYLVTMWPAALATLAVLSVFAALLVHAYRVAQFTFRTGQVNSVNRGEAG